jgi:hypothetical protein
LVFAGLQVRVQLHYPEQRWFTQALFLIISKMFSQLCNSNPFEFHQSILQTLASLLILVELVNVIGLCDMHC